MSHQETPIERQRWWQMPAGFSLDLAQLRSINTLKFLLFVARQTMGWKCRAAIMSYNEIIRGRWLTPEKRMKDVSGLKNDQAVREAIQDAVQRGLVEVGETNCGLAYRIPDRFWVEAELVPEREFWKYAPPWAAYTNGSAQENRADSAAQQAPQRGEQQQDYGCAQESQAQPLEKLSTAIRIPEHSHKKTQAQPLRESTLEEARQNPLDTSLNTSKQDTNRIDTSGADAPGSPAARPISVSKTEKEENEDPPAPEFSGREQAILQAEEDSKSTDAPQGRKAASAPAPTAEPETARQRQRAAIDARRQAQEVERKAKLEAERIASAAKEAEHRAVGKLQERYDALVLAKQKTAPGSPAWQHAQEELQEVKHQLATYGWYL